MDLRKLLRLDRANLMPAVAAAGVVLLALAGIVMVIYNEQSYRQAKVQQADAQSRILATTVSAALVFDDRKAAREYVNALAVDPQVEIAAVYDARGRLFAAYARSGHGAAPAAVTPAPPAIRGEQVFVTVPVQQGQTPLGAIYMQTAIDPISRRLERYGVLALLGTMAALIFIALGAGQRRLSEANERLTRQGAKLAEANENLRAQIEQRETVENALRQAQKMEAMGQLTGGIAHDFNNLLQIIIGNLEILLRRNAVATDDGRKMVQSAIRGAERASTLTQRLLAFGRRQPLNPKPIDVNKLVIGMSELLHRTLGESIRIETVLAGGMWRVAADANQLENALLNLAVNARDAMGSHGRLTIETANTYLDEAYAATHEVKAGQYVQISVTDTGVGMAKDVVQKAFEPFFTTKDAGKGSGLGLSQVYGFIRQSDGHAKIYSEPGEGTTIKLYLPRLRVAEDAAEATTEPEAPLTAHADRTILVVEDDDDVRTHAVAILRELNYNVLEAADAPSALRVMETRPTIDLLFTDVGLPGGVNGRQLADEARRRRPDLLVLFTTGYARNAIVHQGRLDPGVELITKPFTFPALAKKMQAMFEPADEPSTPSASRR